MAAATSEISSFGVVNVEEAEEEDIDLVVTLLLLMLWLLLLLSSFSLALGITRQFFLLRRPAAQVPAPRAR